MNTLPLDIRPTNPNNSSGSKTQQRAEAGKREALMVWQGDPRTSSPPWRRLRVGVLQRDGYRCHICGQPGADEVDHLVPISEGGTDHPTNLAAIHRTPCHAAKSSSEGNKARWRNRASRPPERHPGLL